MKTLDGASVQISVVGSAVKECIKRKTDVLLALTCRSEILEDVFMSDAEATALAQKLLYVVAENKKKRGV